MRNRPAVDASPDARSAIDNVLDRFGIGARRRRGVRVVHLRGRRSIPRPLARAGTARARRQRLARPTRGLVRRRRARSGTPGANQDGNIAEF